MLTSFASMRSRNLGLSSTTQHRIEPLSGALPAFSQPYRASPEACRVIRDHVQGLLRKDCIESVQSEGRRL